MERSASGRLRHLPSSTSLASTTWEYETVDLDAGRLSPATREAIVAALDTGTGAQTQQSSASPEASSTPATEPQDSQPPSQHLLADDDSTSGPPPTSSSSEQQPAEPPPLAAESSQGAESATSASDRTGSSSAPSSHPSLKSRVSIVVDDTHHERVPSGDDTEDFGLATLSSWGHHGGMSALRAAVARAACASGASSPKAARPAVPSPFERTPVKAAQITPSAAPVSTITDSDEKATSATTPTGQMPSSLSKESTDLATASLGMPGLGTDSEPGVIGLDERAASLAVDGAVEAPTRAALTAAAVDMQTTLMFSFRKSQQHASQTSTATIWSSEHSQRPSVVVASAVTMDEAPPHRTSTAGPPQLTVEVPQSPDTYRVPRLSEGSGKGALPSARSLTSLTHAALSQSGRHMRARSECGSGGGGMPSPLPSPPSYEDLMLAALVAPAPDYPPPSYDEALHCPTVATSVHNSPLRTGPRLSPSNSLTRRSPNSSPGFLSALTSAGASLVQALPLSRQNSRLGTPTQSSNTLSPRQSTKSAHGPYSRLMYSSPRGESGPGLSSPQLRTDSLTGALPTRLSLPAAGPTDAHSSPTQPVPVRTALASRLSTPPSQTHAPAHTATTAMPVPSSVSELHGHGGQQHHVVGHHAGPGLVPTHSGVAHSGLSHSGGVHSGGIPVQSQVPVQHPSGDPAATVSLERTARWVDETLQQQCAHSDARSSLSGSSVMTRADDVGELHRAYLPDAASAAEAARRAAAAAAGPAMAATLPPMPYPSAAPPQHPHPSSSHSGQPVSPAPGPILHHQQHQQQHHQGMQQGPGDAHNAAAGPMQGAGVSTDTPARPGQRPVPEPVVIPAQHLGPPSPLSTLGSPPPGVPPLPASRVASGSSTSGMLSPASTAGPPTVTRTGPPPGWRPVPPPPIPSLPHLLYVDGRDRLGRPVVIVNSGLLDSASRDDALDHVLAALQPIVQQPYVLVVINLPPPAQQGPGAPSTSGNVDTLAAAWAVSTYKKLARPYRKNVKHIVLVAPSAMARFMMVLAKPLISHKADAKLKKVRAIHDIATATDGEVGLPALGFRFLRDAKLLGHLPRAPPGSQRTHSMPVMGPGHPLPPAAAAHVQSVTVPKHSVSPAHLDPNTPVHGLIPTVAAQSEPGTGVGRR